MTTPLNNHTSSDLKTGETTLDNTRGSAGVEKPQPDDLSAWTVRMREGISRMANDEAERLKVARRLF